MYLIYIVNLLNVNYLLLLTVTLVASVTLAVLDAVASALVLRIVNYCFPLSYFDFAQRRLQVGKDYMRAYISALAAPSVDCRLLPSRLGIDYKQASFSEVKETIRGRQTIRDRDPNGCRKQTQNMGGRTPAQSSV